MRIVNTPMPRFPIIAELDGVRAIAVLIVFASHLGPLHNLVPGGLGVTVFFFLSGYLITSLLRVEAGNTGKIDLIAFYVRRSFRIFPPLYITLALSGLLLSLGLLTVQRLDIGSVLSQIGFLSNYERLWGPHAGLPGPPLWSLAVEEHFYLIFPFVFGLALMRLTSRTAAIACAAACLIPLLARIGHLAVGHDITLNYFFSHTRADSILAGCALALFKNPALDVNGWRPSIWQFGLGIALILGAALVRNPIFAEVFRYTVQGVGLYIVFAFILTPNRITSPLLLMPWLRWIGRVSYSVYLFQIIAIKLAERFLPNHNFIVIAIVAAGLTLAYAWIMNVRVEKPLYKFRKSRETTNEGSLVTAELAGDHPLR